MVSISALQSAVEALAEGRLAEAEERFMAILLSDPANAMANCGLKDVVHARILAKTSQHPCCLPCFWEAWPTHRIQTASAFRTRILFAASRKFTARCAMRYAMPNKSSASN